MALPAADVERRRWAVLCAVAGGIALTFTVLLGTGVAGTGTTRVISDVGNAIIGSAAAVTLLLRAARSARRTRVAWGLMGLGVLSWSLGQWLWVWEEVVAGRDAPFPGLPDAGYLALAPLMAVGLLAVPAVAQSRAQRARSVVDGLMIAVSILMIGWIVALHPLLGMGDGRAPGRFIVLAYPISDLVVVTIALSMLAVLRNTGADKAPLLLLGAGMLAVTIADCGYAALILLRNYTSGNLLDAGWFAGLTMILLAALRPETVGARAPGPEGEHPRSVGMFMPYAAVLAALLVSIVWLGMNVSVFAGVSRSALILLIIARQVLTVLENRVLTRGLERRVRERAAELTAREQRFRALVQQSSDSLTIVAPDSTVLYQSDSVERIFGYPAGLLRGRPFSDVLDRSSGERLVAGIASVLGRPFATATVELTIPHRLGSRRSAEMMITNLLDDPHVGGLVLNTRDISDSKELQDRLVYEAYHDSLTGLASRVLFRDRLERAFADDTAVLFLDLDGFKKVNDSLGHGAGDQLLIQVAARLRAVAREGDLVARSGGDEFALLAESVTAAEADGIAQRIVEVLREPFDIGGRDQHVGVSIGVAFAGGTTGPEEVLRNADLAMYQAKAAGGGVAGYDRQMLVGLTERVELEADLRRALDRGELEVYYQPTVELAGGSIVGFEALVRWNHPVRGLVAPIDFIGVAEATGLIVPLGRWVLAEACRQAVAWGPRTLKMAVNVSVRQFDRDDLAEMVAAVLAETGLPPQQLCLEMTESVLMTDTEENLAELLRLKALGVTLAMDDFGTGYSSLAYLRRFPMDILKVDRSFVERLGGDAADTALVQMIIRLAQSLGMTTVAEGIETPEQMVVLRDMGCVEAQGYLFSRPVPADRAGQLLRAPSSVPV